MHRNNLRTIAIAAAFAMASQAPALGANPCPNYQRNTGTSDCLYKRDIDDAAARIFWGNRAAPRRTGAILSIDPPLPRIGEHGRRGGPARA